ncbi:MAG: FGGY-family carbohydrate kinase [Leptolyngbya sp.]|nr:FGGY-family carbohydrate kinase [Leptolyngbya sp.]
MALALGIDFGTSGVRAAVVDDQRRERWAYRSDYGDPPQSYVAWRRTLLAVLDALPSNLKPQIGRIALDGTSGTVLLCDHQGQPLVPALMYHDDRGKSVLPQVKALVPADSSAGSATASLAKLLWWQAHLTPDLWQRGRYLLHQADWLSAHLHGRWGISDYHNSLKLGYDPGAMAYPDAMLRQPWTSLLPDVLVPGAVVGRVTADIVRQFGLSPHCEVVAGTTDSIAAFLASGADQVGDGVTSLGSTLAIKLLSAQRVEASEYGIYSHRLGDFWLAGGASNTGGAVLKRFFNADALDRLSQRINPAAVIDLDYYPLIQPGERFPINDPQLAPRLTPRPADDGAFLHGLLLGIARIEQRGYDLLVERGSSPLERVYTAGGGAKNAPWAEIRQRLLQVPIKIAPSTEAAVGAAYLAQGEISAFRADPKT